MSMRKAPPKVASFRKNVGRERGFDLTGVREQSFLAAQSLAYVPFAEIRACKLRRSSVGVLAAGATYVYLLTKPSVFRLFVYFGGACDVGAPIGSRNSSNLDSLYPMISLLS